MLPLRIAAVALAAALLAPGIATASHQPSEAVEDGIAFLRNLQAMDGSVGPTSSSAWAAIAFARAGVDPGTVALAGGASLEDFVVAAAEPIDHSPGLLSTATLSLERQVLAIVASGADPRTAPGFDAVADLLAAFDGTQLGSPATLNDDIFGLLALHAAGLPDSDPVIQAERAFLLANQLPHGGFSFGTTSADNPDLAFAVLFSDVDLTGQAVVALMSTGSSSKDLAVQRALGFIRANQVSDGGCVSSLVNVVFDVFTPQNLAQGNADSTSWAVMGILAAGQDPTGAAWTHPSGQNLASFLLSLQQPNGHFEWRHGDDGFATVSTTAYAIIALAGHTFVA